jgi:autotransporter-associated beta strand protein
VLDVTVLANGGSPSSIGNSTNAAANLNLAGGTLRYSGTTAGTASTDRLFTVSASSIIDASGTGNSGALVRFTNTGNILWGTANETRTLTLNAGTVGNNIIDSLITDNGEGTVSIVKNGSGNWQFTANNTYSGGTTINGGFLRIGAGTASGSVGSGDVTLNGGTFSSGRIDTFEINNLITGSGTVHMNNTGVMVLTNNNTYSGLTNVNASGGTIQMGNGGTSGSIGTSDVFINTGGIFSINRSDDVLISSTISGPGSVTKAGNGTLTLTNDNNSFAGSLSIVEGAVSVSTYAGNPINGTLGTNQITNLGGNGTFGRLIFTGGNFTGANRRFDFATGGGGIIEVTNPDTTLAFTVGSQGGGSLTKEGPGTLNLASGGVFYQGGTVVNEGTLLVNNTNPDFSGTGSGAVLLQSGATLGGTGIIANSIVSFDGTIAPGLTAAPGVVGTLTALQALDTTAGAEDEFGNPIPDAPNSTLAIDLIGDACDKLVLTNGNFTPGTFKLAINATGTQTLPAYVIVDSLAANNSGPFLEITGLPEGYGVVYNYNDGSDTFNIAIVSGVSSDPFSTYMVAMGLEGAALTDDNDNDGYSNLEEFMFDGHPNPANANASAKPKGAPTQTLDGTYLTITYGRSQTAMTQPGISVGVEYGSDLTGWTTTVNGVGGVIITEFLETELTDGFGSETYSGDLGIDKIEVKIPRSLAGSTGKLFARVKINVTAP